MTRVASGRANERRTREKRPRERKGERELRGDRRREIDGRPLTANDGSVVRCGSLSVGIHVENVRTRNPPLPGGALFPCYRRRRERGRRRRFSQCLLRPLDYQSSAATLALRAAGSLTGELAALRPPASAAVTAAAVAVENPLTPLSRRTYRHPH